MDWANVTPEELLSSLQEVDWSQGPQSPQEFLGKFSLPDSKRKLETRLKCNAYYYRANYVLLLLLAFSIAFLRAPAALISIAFILLASLCLNNTFAQSLSNNTLKLVRKLHPPTAQKLRSISGGHAGLGAPGRTKMDIKIVGVPRKLVVAACYLVALLLLFRRGALLHLALAGLIGISVVLAHASFRVPNLKTRLASAREEFRAVWRGYQADHDYIA